MSTMASKPDGEMAPPKMGLFRKHAAGLMAALSLVAGALPARAVVYQWSTPLEEVVSRESKGHPRAFLWIPERCQRVRAVVIADQNMEEEQLFGNAEFRKTLSDLDFALVWI